MERKNNITLTLSVVVVVVIALGVWWYLRTNPPPATANTPISPPATGQLQGTVR